MHPLARVAPPERHETHHSSGPAPAPDRAAPFEPPRYGQAAAIYALYQQGFVKPRTKPTRPRRPGGGKLTRTLVAAAAVLRGLTPAEA